MLRTVIRLVPFALVVILFQWTASPTPAAATGTPELSIQLFTSQVSGNDVLYSATIANSGSAEASFFLRLWFDRTTAPTCSSTDYDFQAPASISAAAAVPLPGTVFFGSNEYKTWLMIDAACQVAESNETDNTASTSFTIPGAVSSKEIRPTNLVGQAVGSGIDLSWTPAVEDHVTGYNVQRATTSGGPYIRLNASPVESSSYRDDQGSSGVTYHYVVRSITPWTNVTWESGDSNEASGTVPTTPVPGLSVWGLAIFALLAGALLYTKVRKRNSSLRV